MATVTRDGLPATISRVEPRIVGGMYWSGYWQKSYRVVEIGQDAIYGTCWTCEWSDGRVTRHSTAWDARRDRVLHE